MKKFCTECGNQLELSQRLCTKCGAPNPFFTSAFSFLSDQSGELEKLRVEKERIEKELSEKEEQQAEFIRQEQLKKEAEDAEKLKIENEKRKNAKKSEAEREQFEKVLKEEILKVKKETLEQQRETLGLVKEVKEELQHIEEDNKRLKKEIAALAKPKRESNEITSTSENVSLNERATSERRILVSILLIIVGIMSVAAFFYFTRVATSPTSNVIQNQKQEVALQPAGISSVTADTVITPDTSARVVDSTPVQKEIAAEIPVKKEKPMPPVETPTELKFDLTETRIMHDLPGKRISGCDIVIGSSSEIENVGNITLVEKSSVFLKYKFTAIIAQGSDNYTATPYLYYTPDGKFIRIDGTNCE